MSNDTIIDFKKPDDPNIRREVADSIVSGAPVTLPDGSAVEVTAHGLGFTDIEAAMNMRAWVERACEAAGAKRVGAGIGFGQADIEIELEGCRFNVSIRPLHPVQCVCCGKPASGKCAGSPS